MQAAENFKRQENPAGFGEVPSTVSQPIQEESEEEEEVGFAGKVWFHKRMARSKSQN